MREFSTLQAVPDYAPHTFISPVHMDIALAFDLPKRKIDAKVTTTFSCSHRPCPGEEIQRSISLNAVGFLNVKVTGDHVFFRYDGQTIDLTWESAFAVKEERQVVIEYQVEQPRGGLYFHIPDSKCPTHAIHCVTDHETERCRYWLPCVDFPAIRTTLTFHLTAPLEYTAIANGALMKEEIHGALKTTHYELKVPCPSYLICLAVGEFTSVVDKPFKDIPIAYFAVKGTPADWLTRGLGKTRGMMEWLTKKLDTSFPWPKYYQIASPLISGAMENISFVTWNETYCLLDETFAKERQWLSDLVNIHEMAHTYFGDLLVIRHFEHTWLKEGWATYIEAVWCEENISEDEMRYQMLDNAKAYIKETNSKYMRPIVTRVYDSSWAMFDRHTYPGGAWRLHMLRHLLGDESFWAGVRKYVKDYSGKTVETEDFRKYLEDASGLNLNKFFDQWLYSKGFPTLKGTYNYSSEENKVTITFEQTQMKDKEIPYFDFVLDVEITDSQDKKRTKKIIFNDQNPKKSVSFGFEPRIKPKYVRIDPVGKILFSLDMNPGEDVLEQTAIHAEDIVNRVWALEELVKIGGVSASQKIKRAYDQEPFYGVRRFLAMALGKSRSRFAHDLLKHILNTEKDPQVLQAALGALSQKDSTSRTWLLAFLKRTDLAYRTHAVALESLGSQRNKDDISFLIDVTKNKELMGQHSIIRSGAFRALGKIGHLDALDYLLDQLESGQQPERARIAIVDGLVSLYDWIGERHKKRVREALCGLLKEESIFIRFSVVWGLFDLESKDIIPAIQQTQSQFTHQEWAFVTKKLKALKESSGDDKVVELNKRVEELEEKLRKLETLLVKE